MTEASLLTAIKSHLTHQGEEAAGIFLPDLYTLIAPALLALSRRVSSSRELSNMLLATQSVSTTSGTPAEGLFTATLPTTILSKPPFRQVNITHEDGTLERALYSAVPLRYDANCVTYLPCPYYSVVGTSLQILIPEGRTTSPASVSITATFVPTIVTLPAQLETQLIDEILMRLGVLKREGARK